MVTPEVDVVVVGAGFAGMYMLHRLRQSGFTAQVIEAGGDVGGTWYWNRYPGARCDVPSMEYSYSFDPDLQQEWEWTERYATQPEIFAYATAVADRFDLRRDIAFDTRVEAAEFDDDRQRWMVATDAGDHIDAQFVVMATGCLSTANKPEFPGEDLFTGERHHTGHWPHEGVDFTGLRVGVIGTGSSAIQAIPRIAAQAAHLTVFQRTPNFTIPAHNRPLDPDEVAEIKADYDAFRAENRLMPAAFGARGKFRRADVGVFDVDDEHRRRRLEERWDNGGLAFLGAFNDIGLNPDANEIVAAFVRDKIEQIVDDPEVAAMLQPDQRIGCKRLCVDTDYYATFNRDNVRLVDLRATPIERFTPDGVQTTGEDFAFDAVVFATGFDAMTGALLAVDIRGRGGRSLRDKWSAGPHTYLGVQTEGFPNLFMITGPGSPSVLTNMIVSIEHHVEFIGDCLDHLRAAGAATIEPEPDVEEHWVRHVNAVADSTIYPHCNSWYLGANVPGKPRVFMPLIGFPPYVERVETIVADGYRGFAIA